MKALRCKRCLALGLTRCLTLSLALFLGGVQPAFAVTVRDLYEVTLPTEGNRDAAFVEALRLVVVRVSGQRDAATRLGPTLDNPRRYVQRFGFTADNQLQVGFDNVAIDRLLSDASLPVWGHERPATLVLLSVQDASGAVRWVDSTTPAAERDQLGRAAKARGLPLVWPSREPQLAGTDAPSLLQAAVANNANATLLGQARRDAGGGYFVRWTLVSDDGATEDSGALEDGVHLAADSFARVFAAAGSTLESVALEVVGVASLDAYAHTLNYLESLTLVRSVALEQVAGDSLRFRLAVRGGAATLQRALALDSRLVPVTPAAANPPAVTDRLRFRYQGR